MRNCLFMMGLRYLFFEKKKFSFHFCKGADEHTNTLKKICVADLS